MKSLKTKVMASLAMLLVAAVMMTSSSFAWYTISTKGDISKIKVKMTATDTMEIAVAETEPGETKLGDAGNQQTWGSTAVFDASTTSQLFQVADYSTNGATESTVKPASGSQCKLWTPEYDETNRLKAELKEAATKAEATYEDDKATPVIMMDNNGNECAYVYDFWVRSNKYGTAYVKKGTGCKFEKSGTTGTITVVFVNLDDGKVIGVWDADDQTTFGWSLQPGTGENSGYQVGHVAVYTYVNGETIKGKDIDSGETTFPTFEGDFVIEGTN